MNEPDYARCLHSALTKAFRASDSRVRFAYFDLASFYHRKLGDRANMHPAAELLKGIAREGCRKTECWCK